jgi:hypothetical protein
MYVCLSLAHMDKFDISIVAVLALGEPVGSRTQIHLADRVAGSWHLHSTPVPDRLLTSTETADSNREL